MIEDIGFIKLLILICANAFVNILLFASEHTKQVFLTTSCIFAGVYIFLDWKKINILKIMFPVPE